MRRAAAAVAVLGALALALAAAPAGAAASKPRASLPDIEDEVMCVQCGVPLEIAESPEADRERAFIRGLIARGKTKGQIEDALVAQYGRRVLATPRDSGFDLSAWLVPGGLALVALAAGAAAVVRWRRSTPRAAAPAGAPAGPALSEREARRLDDELARFDG